MGKKSAKKSRVEEVKPTEGSITVKVMCKLPPMAWAMISQVATWWIMWEIYSR